MSASRRGPPGPSRTATRWPTGREELGRARPVGEDPGHRPVTELGHEACPQIVGFERSVVNRSLTPAVTASCQSDGRAGVFADTAPPELSEPVVRSGPPCRCSARAWRPRRPPTSTCADAPEVAAILIVDELRRTCCSSPAGRGARRRAGPPSRSSCSSRCFRVSESLSHVRGRVAIPAADDERLGQSFPWRP